MNPSLRKKIWERTEVQEMSKQKNMTGQIATLKKVMHYLKHYIPILILSVVLATVTVALTLYFPILTGRAIDLILDKGNVDFPGILAIAKEGAIVIGITAAAQWIMNMCNNRMTYNIVRDIRRDAFERIEHLPLSYIDSHSHGDMVSRIIADVDTVWQRSSVLCCLCSLSMLRLR